MEDVINPAIRVYPVQWCVFKLSFCFRLSLVQTRRTAFATSRAVTLNFPALSKHPRIGYVHQGLRLRLAHPFLLQLVVGDVCLDVLLLNHHRDVRDPGTLSLTMPAGLTDGWSSR